MKRLLDKMQKHEKHVALAALVGIPTILLLIGGAIITNALIYAILVCVAFAIILLKMGMSDSKPMKKAYAFICSHPLMADVVFSTFAFIMSPGGITGMLGASIAALIVSCLLILLPKEERENEEATSKTKNYSGKSVEATV